MEKGAAPKEWHLHYCLDLFSLITNQVTVSDGKSGESLTNYCVMANDLILGDRAYGTKTSMKHCKDHEGNFIFRRKNRAFNFYDSHGKQQNLSKELSKGSETEPFEIKGYVKFPKKEKMAIRICAVKLSDEAIEKENKRISRKNSKRPFELSQESVFTHRYMFMVTSLQEEISAREVLD